MLLRRYPHHAITRWAMESPRGADQGLADIMEGGLRRFTALRNLTICKCKVRARAAYPPACHTQLQAGQPGHMQVRGVG